MKTPIPSIPCAIRYKGKKYARHTVVISQSALSWSRELVVSDVIARTPEEAIAWVRDNVQPPVPDYPANWTSWGPKGGEVFRYAGWFSTVGEALWRRVAPSGQSEFPFLIA